MSDQPKTVPFSRLGGFLHGDLPAHADPDGLVCCFSIWPNPGFHIAEGGTAAPLWVDVHALPSVGHGVLGKSVHPEFGNRTFFVQAIVWLEHNLVQVVLEEAESSREE